VVAPVAVSLVLIPLRGEVIPANESLVLVVVVLVAAIVGGRLGGVTAALVAAASFDFFFTRPYYSFTIDAHDDVVTTILLLVVGLAVGEITTRSRHSRRLAAERGADITQMRRHAQLGAGGEPPSRLIHLAASELVELLDARTCWFERPPYPVALPTLGHGQMTVWGDESGAARLDPMPATLLALAVFGDGREQGRLVLEFGSERRIADVDARTRALAVGLADRLGTALAHAR
jgi:GAF domain-containing protein